MFEKKFIGENKKEITPWWFLFYFIGNCCSVVVVRQEFREKFLPKCCNVKANTFLYKKYVKWMNPRC